MIFITSREERDLVARLRALGSTPAAAALSTELVTLREEVSALKIEKSRLTEEFERRERELKHMVGLEQARQQAERTQHRVEIEQASKAATLTVREENLAAERKRFEDQLQFNTERFATMEAYLKEMMGDILKRLPNVNVKLKGGV